MNEKIPDNMILIPCNQVGCMHGEFAWPSSKGLCPKCGGTGQLLRLKPKETETKK